MTLRGIWFAILASSLSWAGVTCADDADKKLIATVAAQFESLQTETLPNGLRVYMLPVKGATTVTTMVAYKVGSCDEEKDQTGLSHYLEHLLFKGTDKLVPGDIDRMTQRNGGRNNAYTSEDMTVYHFDFAADRWKAALEIEADRMRNTKIDEKHEFQQEKGAVISELKGGEDMPWDLEYKTILPRLYPKAAPYAHPVIGEEKHVRAATAEIIQRHYNRWYHPNNAALVIVGGFEPKETLELVKKLFGKILKSDLPERKPEPKLTPRTTQSRYEFNSKFDVARLMVGFNSVKVGEHEDYVLDVVDSILSEGKTARLYKRLVDGDRLANSVGTQNNTGRYPGWFGVQVEMLKGKNRLDAEKAVFEELDKLANTKVSDEELKRVRRRLVATFLFSKENVHDLADLISRSVTYSDVDYARTYLERIMAVTPEDIQKCVAKLLNKQQSVVIWSIPEDDPIPPRKGGDATPPKDSKKQRLLKAEPAGATTGISLKDAKRVELKNGMVVILLENRRLPIVVAEAYVADTRLREPVAKSGVSALLGELLSEGTTKRSAAEIANIIENTGGSMSLGSSGGALKVLTPDTDIGLELLFECMLQPKFTAETFEQKREQLLSVIADVETQPKNRSQQKLKELIYGDHPFGRSAYGKRAIVEKLTQKDCLDFHASTFVPNNTTVVVVGDFETETMVKKLETLTANWKPAKLEPLKIKAPLATGSPGESIISDAGAAQSHVYIGHLGITRDSADYHTLLVMDNVLGVGPGFTDRLSSNLRDRKGLAYTVNASITSTAGEQPGMFIGYIGTFRDKYVDVRDGFLKEFNLIRNEPATQQEVDDAKKYLLGSLPFRLSTNESIASELLTAEKFKLGFDFIDTYRKKVEAVTVADVQAAAKKYLDPKKLSIVIVGPVDSTGKALPEPKE